MQNLLATVVENNTKEVLFSCEMHEIEKAYSFASQMDQLGLDVSVNSPTVLESLSHTLGLSHHEESELLASADRELEDHDASCCATKGSTEKI